MVTEKTSRPSSRWQQSSESARDRFAGWRRKAATLGVGLLSVAMGYGVLFGHNGVTAYLHKRQETKSLEQQMQRLQAENDRLEGHVERLQNDPGAIEHQAREELHYTRPGEVIYDLPVVKPSAASQSSPKQ
jgi:cell division protein FtsB